MYRAPLSSAALILASLLGALTAGSLPVHASSRQAAPPPFPIVLRPTDAQGGAIAGPDYFTITALPGSTTTLYAYVGNAAHKTKGISLTPVDGASALYGGVSFTLPRQHLSMVGKWVTMSHRWVSLESKRAMVVPFTVTIPLTTKPGSYMGGLSAFVQATPTPGKGMHMMLQLRSVNAIVVTVPGTGATTLKLKRISLMQRGTMAFAIVHIRNKGTMPTKASFFLWLWKQGQKKPILFKQYPVDSILARTGVDYPVEWAMKSSPGHYVVKAQLTWPGQAGTPLQRQDSFTVAR